MSGVTSESGSVRIGAGTPVAQLDGELEPLGSAARGVADGEIRASGTVGGNLCAGPSADAPRGDLQAPLIALGATVRSAGKGGERSDPVEAVLAERWAPEAAAKEALVDCDPPTDALASAWYRKRMLPLLITRALEGLA